MRAIARPLVLVALLAAGCGGGGDEAPAPAPGVQPPRTDGPRIDLTIRSVRHADRAPCGDLDVDDCRPRAPEWGFVGFDVQLDSREGASNDANAFKFHVVGSDGILYDDVDASYFLESGEGCNSSKQVSPGISVRCEIWVEVPDAVRSGQLRYDQSPDIDRAPAQADWRLP